eukprot:1117776-Pelagomonas_calceolata.AAC.3
MKQSLSTIARHEADPVKNCKSMKRVCSQQQKREAEPVHNSKGARQAYKLAHPSTSPQRTDRTHNHSCKSLSSAEEYYPAHGSILEVCASSAYCTISKEFLSGKTSLKICHLHPGLAVNLLLLRRVRAGKLMSSNDEIEKWCDDCKSESLWV